MDKRYLLQRKRGWYIRYAIPSKAQQYLGKSEFVVSLKTRSLEEAKIRKLYYLQSFSREIQSVLNLGYLNSKETDFEKIEPPCPIPSKDAQDKTEVENQKVFDENSLSKALELFLREQKNNLTNYTWQRKEQNIKQFIEYVGDREIVSITKRDTGNYLNGKLLTENFSRNTLLGKLCDIGSLFNWALKVGMIDFNPIKGLASTLSKPKHAKTDNDVNVPFTNEMLHQLLKHTKKEKNIFRLTVIGMFTGMRIEEICRLKISDFEEDCLTIREGKTQSAPRKVPVHSLLIPMVHLMIESTLDQYLISGLNPYRDKRSHSISKKFGIRRNQLGFQKRKYTFHSLRANFITELDNLGIDLSIIERLVGHSHQGLIRSVYSGGLRIEKLRDVIEKLNYGSEINFLIKDNCPDFS